MRQHTGQQKEQTLTSTKALTCTAAANAPEYFPRRSYIVPTANIPEISLGGQMKNLKNISGCQCVYESRLLLTELVSSVNNFLMGLVLSLNYCLQNVLNSMLCSCYVMAALKVKLTIKQAIHQGMAVLSLTSHYPMGGPSLHCSQSAPPLPHNIQFQKSDITKGKYFISGKNRVAVIHPCVLNGLWSEKFSQTTQRLFLFCHTNHKIYTMQLCFMVLPLKVKEEELGPQKRQIRSST